LQFGLPRKYDTGVQTSSYLLSNPVCFHRARFGHAQLRVDIDHIVQNSASMKSAIGMCLSSLFGLSGVISRMLRSTAARPHAAVLSLRTLGIINLAPARTSASMPGGIYGIPLTYSFGDLCSY
jgi:hypothetical protein